MSEVKRILVTDLDDGVVWARLDKIIETSEGPVEIYKMIEYYHTLRDALRDLYGIDIEEEKVEPRTAKGSLD